MRIVFMGTPDFSVPVLTEIAARGHDIVAVYTRAPKPAGRRGLETLPSPVALAATKLGLPILTPTSLRTPEAAALFASHKADIAIVVAYGLILPKAILDAPARGCLNLHASLLPRWRGAAPIQRAIMAGDRETGVAVMRMEETLDTGPVALEERVAIGAEMTAGELHDKLSSIGADLIARTLDLLAQDELTFTPQPTTGVTYAEKISKAEAVIDWSRDAAALHDLVRGLSPFPGAAFFVDLGKGAERIKVLRSHTVAMQGVPGTILDGDLTIACGRDALRLLEVQRAGRAPMSAAEFLRGARLARGALLRQPD
ncbi:methionyl-tRNA formyltransferase [Methylovirgula ligni]|nr:methionyl-tRNA formyltransferase [Methylovirgula ligni]